MLKDTVKIFLKIQKEKKNRNTIETLDTTWHKNKVDKENSSELRCQIQLSFAILSFTFDTFMECLMTQPAAV